MPWRFCGLAVSLVGIVGIVAWKASWWDTGSVMAGAVVMGGNLTLLRRAVAAIAEGRLVKKKAMPLFAGKLIILVGVLGLFLSTPLKINGMCFALGVTCCLVAFVVNLWWRGGKLRAQEDPSG